MSGHEPPLVVNTAWKRYWRVRKAVPRAMWVVGVLGAAAFFAAASQWVPVWPFWVLTGMWVVVTVGGAVAETVLHSRFEMIKDTWIRSGIREIRKSKGLSNDDS